MLIFYSYETLSLRLNFFNQVTHVAGCYWLFSIISAEHSLCKGNIPVPFVLRALLPEVMLLFNKQASQFTVIHDH